MSSSSKVNSRKRLPVNPSAENLKKQAKRLSRKDPSLSLQQAQHRLANEYGCGKWDELLHVVETMSRGATQLSGVKYAMEPLPAAANRNDLDAVTRILDDGPFTQHDLDLALARAVLRFQERRAIAELLIEHGADPDGQYGSNYGPIIFVTGECLDPDGLQFLIDHGADVTFPAVATKYGGATPMSCTLGSYVRGQNERKHRCIEIHLKHGAIMPSEVTAPMLAVHRGDAKALADMIERDPSLLSRRFANMPYGNMDLRGASLVHLAVEFTEIECLDVLLDRGGNINLPADIVDGLGGQTPIYHGIATNFHAGVKVIEHLVQRGDTRVDLSVRATFRVYGEAQSTPLSPLEYAERSSAADVSDWRRSEEKEIELLKSM
jgi:hypothetical protein